MTKEQRIVEQQVLADLLEWIQFRNPSQVNRYYLSQDKKATARDLLRYRISLEPNYAFALPKEILMKLKYNIVDYVPDPIVETLSKAIKAKIDYAIQGVDHA